MKTSTKMIFSFVAIAVIMLAMGATGYYGITTVHNDLEETETNILPKIQTSLTIRLEQNIVKTAQRTILMTDMTDEEIDHELENIQKSFANIDSAWADIKSFKMTAEESAMWQDMESKWNLWVAESNNFLALVETYKRAKTTDNYEAMRENTTTTIRQSYNDASDKLTEIAEYYNNEATQMREDSEGRASLLMTISLIEIIVGFVVAGIGIILVLGINRGLSSVAEKVGKSSGLVASASVQLATSSQQLSEGASEQAASIEETSATMEETSSMVSQNAENTRLANDFAKEANKAANEGSKKMDDMSKSMDELKKSSSEISKIIKVIDDIAFQTNMLALNAAVEAARAGDAGQGFAVVAEEVRNLAQKSAQAAKDTAEIIDRNIELSENGVSISGEISVALEEIMEKSGKVNQLMDEIASASEEQARGTAQISDAIGQMEKVIQSNASTSEESAAAAEELKSHAQGLKEAFMELSKVLYGNSAAKKQAAQKEVKAIGSTEKRQIKAEAPKKQIVAPDDVIPLDDNDDF